MRGTSAAAVQKPPEGAIRAPMAPETKAAILKALRADPALTASELSERFGVSRRYVQQLRDRYSAADPKSDMETWRALLRSKLPLSRRAAIVADLARSKNPAASVSALKVALEADGLVQKQAAEPTKQALFALSEPEDLDLSPINPEAITGPAITAPADGTVAQPASEPVTQSPSPLVK